MNEITSVIKTAEHNDEIQSSDLILRRVSTEAIDSILDIARTTYYETFASDNLIANLRAYLDGAFAYDKIKAELNDDTNYFYLIEYQSQHMGYFKLQTRFDANNDIPDIIFKNKSILLDRFYIYKKWHGTGVAKIAMQFCLQVSRELNNQLIWLGVWEKNHRAIAFYKKFQFILIGSHLFIMGEEAQRDYWLMHLLR